MLFPPLRFVRGPWGARAFSTKLLSHLHRASRRGARRWRMFAIWHLQKEFASRGQESKAREVIKGRKRQQREDKIKAERLESRGQSSSSRKAGPQGSKRVAPASRAIKEKELARQQSQEARQQHQQEMSPGSVGATIPCEFWLPGAFLRRASGCQGFLRNLAARGLAEGSSSQRVGARVSCEIWLPGALLKGAPLKEWVQGFPAKSGCQDNRQDNKTNRQDNRSSRQDSKSKRPRQQEQRTGTEQQDQEPGQRAAGAKDKTSRQSSQSKGQHSRSKGQDSRTSKEGSSRSEGQDSRSSS